MSRDDWQRGHVQLLLRCLDIDAGEQTTTVSKVLSDHLEDELHAIDHWLTRLRKLVRDEPFWSTGNPFPAICQPEVRRRLGLSVTQPVWCEGRVGPPSFRGASPEQIRQQLRERLRRLPRGLQDPNSGAGGG